MFGFRQGHSSSRAGSRLYPSEQALYSIPYSCSGNEEEASDAETAASAAASRRASSARSSRRQSRCLDATDAAASASASVADSRRAASVSSRAPSRRFDPDDKYTSDSPIYMSTKLDKSNSRLSAPVYSQVATPKRRHSTERRVMSTLQPPQPAPRRSSSSNRSAGFTAAAASPSPSARSQSRRSPAPSAPPVDVDATYVGGGGYSQPDYERIAKFQPSMFADSYSRVAAQRGVSPAAGRRNTNENAQPQPEVLKPELPTLRRRSTSHERK